MPKVTIEDISRATGLSRGTVSRALNDRPDISARTKQRVLETCRKLNYVRSHAARSLATGRNFAVAVLVDDLRSAFAASFLRGVISRAEQARYAVHPIELGPQPQLDRLGFISPPDRIDAVLNAAALDPPLTNRLRESLGERVLASCWPLRNVSCDVLTPDQSEAGRMVTRFVLKSGCRRVLYVRRAAASDATERLAGFREVCDQQGVSPQAATVAAPEASALESLGGRLEQAEAVLASDDHLAISIMIACERLGRRPGVDIAVIGHGNLPAAGAVCPSLSTVDPAGEEIGRRAMETALQRLGKMRMDAPQHTQVAPMLIRRESTRHLEKQT